MIGRGPNKPKPIRDTTTGKQYKSMGEAGRALAKEANGDPEDPFVWYNNLLPVLGEKRFQTKNPDGEWVALDDPSAPSVTLVRD